MDATLTHVSQDKLQEAWRLVHPGLARVKKHSASNWIAEDIYAEIRMGRSTLHLGYLDGKYVGFLILSPTPVFDGMTLHIWCAYSSSKENVVPLFLPEVEKMARSIGAKRLTFWSPRAWTKKIEPYGFRMNQTEYVKEL